MNKDLGFFSITSSLTNTLTEIINTKIDVFQSGTVKEINDEISKQSFSLQLLQQQARVAQELAIALRLETADEVVIEEFYDKSKEGGAGTKENKDGISIGLNGSDRKINRRIYRFKGYNEKKPELYEQNEMIPKKKILILRNII